MRILGIDPGTIVMGFGVVDSRDDSIRLVDCGTIEIPRALPIAERLKRLYAGVGSVIERHLPAEVAVEEPFVSENRRSALAIGQAQAVAMLAAANHDLSVHCYPPSRIKQMVCNSGAGGKEQVQQMVRLHLGLGDEPLALDATDALAVAICHMQRRRLEEITGAAQP